MDEESSTKIEDQRVNLLLLNALARRKILMLSLHFAMFRKPQALNSEENYDMNVKAGKQFLFLFAFSRFVLACSW